MVGAAIAGVGMDQDGQPQAVELQPRHQHRQQVVVEAEVERRCYMRAARLQVPVAQFHREALGRPAPQQGGFLEAVFIEVDMCVIALDVGIGARGGGQRGFAGTHAGWPRGGFAGRGLAPGTAPLRRRRHDGTEAGTAGLGGVRCNVAMGRCRGCRGTGHSGGQPGRGDEAPPCRRKQVGPVGVIVAVIDEEMRVRLHEGLRGGMGVGKHARSGSVAGGVQ